MTTETTRLPDSTVLTPEQRATIAALIGNAQPARNSLLTSLGESIRDRREHEHPTWEDLFCLNLVSYMGERMAPVLRRLLDAEARVAELEQRNDRRRVRLIAAEADLLAVRGLLSPADGPRRIPADIQIHERVAPAIEWLLNRVAELEARLLEHDRPADEDPIRYTLTEKQCGADLGPGYRCQRPAGHSGDCEPTPDAEDDVTPQVERLRALLAGKHGETGGAQ